MFLLSIFLSVQEINCAREYDPRVNQQPNTTFMDVFMAMFMLCTFEVILVKILTGEDSGPEDTREYSASVFFDR